MLHLNFEYEVSVCGHLEQTHLIASAPHNQQAATRLQECEIRALDNNGRPSQAVPLKHGYFEVPLPKELFATNPESIMLNWVDFYR